jgi:uncharacterized RDD family membrane protein YckC
VRSLEFTTCEIAGPWRRLFGYVVDVLVLAPLLLTAILLLGLGVAFALTGLALSGAYFVVGVARWGRTFGKLVVGTRVVDERTRRIPSWRAAVVRWGVPALPGMCALLIAYPVLLADAWLLVVYVGILQPPLRRGLHDRAADTVVVDDGHG